MPSTSMTAVALVLSAGRVRHTVRLERAMLRLCKIDWSVRTKGGVRSHTLTSHGWCGWRAWGPSVEACDPRSRLLHKTSKIM